MAKKIISRILDLLEQGFSFQQIREMGFDDLLLKKISREMENG